MDVNVFYFQLCFVLLICDKDRHDLTLFMSFQEFTMFAHKTEDSFLSMTSFTLFVSANHTDTTLCPFSMEIQLCVPMEKEILKEME